MVPLTSLTWFELCVIKLFLLATASLHTVSLNTELITLKHLGMYVPENCMLTLLCRNACKYVHDTHTCTCWGYLSQDVACSLPVLPGA